MDTELDGTRVPTRYANDPRVIARGPGLGYTVTRMNIDYYIEFTEVFAWSICVGPTREPMIVAAGEHATGIRTATFAIEALIGEPVEGLVTA